MNVRVNGQGWHESSLLARNCPITRCNLSRHKHATRDLLRPTSENLSLAMIFYNGPGSEHLRRLCKGNGTSIQGSLRV